jgi:HPt (histidine-containing phosphotransfer) domain-containing protein
VFFRWAPARSADDSASETTASERAGKTVRALAHRIKGAAKMISAHRLSAASHALQDGSEPLGASSPTAAERDAALCSLEVWRVELARLLLLLEKEPAGHMVADPVPRTVPGGEGLATE